MAEKTAQELFWQGEFGDDYTDRNWGGELQAASIALFVKILCHMEGISSAIEFGANRGINLISLKTLVSKISLQAVEINEKAANECEKIEGVSVFKGSVFDYPVNKTFDLSFTRGVLIHMEPKKLVEVYKKLYDSSNRYIVVAEYYNPSPVEVEYRGNVDRLFKRDFAGELLDMYSDLKLIDYGFCYHREYSFPTDDITWFLMEKGPV